jgi:diacylglycerol kinase family enzyme
MAFEEFGSLVSGICAHVTLVQGRPIFWTIIANPTAGGFTIKSRWKKHHTQLSECVQRAIKKPLNEKSGPSQTAISEGGHSGLISTKAMGHAREITDNLIKEASLIAKKGAVRPIYLIVTAGGDGTSLEVLTGLYHAPPNIRDNFVVLRLPMGTGNDGADARELDKALNLLIEPVIFSRQRALRLSTASGKGPYLAFNILSVGIDAFVTHMTNKIKGKLPGDSYKLWIDIAALFYDCLYKVDFMDVRALSDDGKEVKAFREKLLLLAVGESGRRSYGSHKWILPDDRNVCAIKQTSLFRKISLKGLFATGTHIGEKEAMLWNAAAVDFSAQHPILAQMDGETVLLDKNDFPARIELTEPVIPILKKKDWVLGTAD